MKRAVILDRDGVINDNSKIINVNKPEQFHLFPHAAEAIALLNHAGFTVVVATNQGGVGLGYMTEDDLNRIHAYMCELLSQQGAVIDGIAACTHAPHAGCKCRKPEPGMLFNLAEQHQFNLSQSYMVGDRVSDIEAGRAAGCKTVFLGNPADSGADTTFPGILPAAEWIVRDSTTA